MEKAVQAFKKKNKDTYEDRGRLMAKVPLKHFHLQDYVKEILKEKYVKEKFKSVRNIKFG